jgi:hypothetical protein
MRIPILSEYEEEKIILNLEQRPQMTTRVFTKSFDARSVEKIIKSIYCNTSKSNTLGHLTYLYSMIKNPFLFDNIIKKYTNLNNNIVPLFNIYNYIYKYPAKNNLNSFYSSGKVVKHSFIMQRAFTYFNTFDTNFKF